MAQALQGKVAFVSGAGKNIGRGIALALARDGATILVNGRSDRAAVDRVVGEIEAAGGKAVVAIGDVADPAVAPRLADQAKALGGADILVSNAGLRRQTSFLDMSFAEWREIMSVALDGAFLLGKAFIPQMVATVREVAQATMPALLTVLLQQEIEKLKHAAEHDHHGD